MVRKSSQSHNDVMKNICLASIAFVTAFIIIYIVAKLLNQRQHFTLFDASAAIPKVIWTYWDDPNSIPDEILKCIALMKLINPDYNVNVLSQKDAHAWGITSYLHTQGDATRTSDFIRLEALERFGGIWIDCSSILTQSLNWVHDQQKEIVMFYADFMTTRQEYPVIENWFIAAAKNSKFIKLWNAEFKKINSYPDIADYISKRVISDLKIDVQNISPGMQTYLAQHVAAQVVLQKQFTPAEIQTILYVSPASKGPFKYLVDNQWESDNALRSLCDIDINNTENLPQLIKLRGAERKALEKDEQASKCVFKLLDTLAKRAKV